MTDIASSWRMFVPQSYRASDPEAIISHHAFGQIVTAYNGMPYATSVPMYLEDGPMGERILFGHMARDNPQAATLMSGMKALATFHGPNTYISASWYKDQPTVPTWNYVAAQVRGTLTPIDDDEKQLAIMRKTIDRSEARTGTSWLMKDAPAGKIDSLLPRIRSFQITVERIDGVTKLSQKHPPADRERVIAALEALPGVAEAQIAALMRNLGNED
jgi:transcriptional regulator